MAPSYMTWTEKERLDLIALIAEKALIRNLGRPSLSYQDFERIRLLAIAPTHFLEDNRSQLLDGLDLERITPK